MWGYQNNGIISSLLLYLIHFQYILIGIIFLAGIVVNIDEKLKLRAFFQRSIVLAMLMMISISFMSVFLKKAVAQNGYWEVTLWVGILSQFFLFITIPYFYKEAKRISLKQIGAVGLIAAFSMVGTLAANKAYAENVSISSVIISLPLQLIHFYDTDDNNHPTY